MAAVTFAQDIAERLAAMHGAGLYKSECSMHLLQGAHVLIDENGEVVNFCANNYLSLANHPEVVQAAHDALDRWGYGMAVRSLHMRHASAPPTAGGASQPFPGH